MCWPPLAYFVLTVPMTWPLLPQLATSLPSLGDAQLQAWTLAWNGYALRHAPSQVWNAPIFFPYPDTLAYTDNHLLLSVAFLPLLWATNNPILVHNVMVLVSFALTGWAVYSLGYEFTQRRWPAFIAGAAFAFCAYRLAHVIQLNLLQTSWLPLALLFLVRLLRPVDEGGGRLQDGLFCGLFAGIQCATALYYAFFTAAVLGGYSGLWLCEQLWRRFRAAQPLPWRTFVYLGLAGFLTVLITLPLTLPYMRVYGSLAIVRSVRELDNWSAPLRAYWSVEERNLVYGSLGERFVDSGEMVLFPGLLVTLLGMSGLLLIFRTRHGLFWGLLLTGAFVLSLGTGIRWERFAEPLPIPLPYSILYSRLPGFGALRVPARWGMLVSLALAILAAFALARLLQQLRGPALYATGLALLGVVLAEQAVRPLAMPDSRQLLQVPPVYRWLAEPAQAHLRAVLELPVERVPRGAELERITWRQWYGKTHWKALPVAYSGLIPFGTTDLLARVQNLPDPAPTKFLQLAGIDTVVIHGDQYPSEQLQQLLTDFDASSLFTRQATIGSAIVYTLAPPPTMLNLRATPDSATTVCISGDERMPGLLVLALSKRWQEAGLELYGPGRPRFYQPFRSALPGMICDYGLLSDAEDALNYGYTSSNRLWSGSGLALYRRDAATILNVNLGRPVKGEFHPRFPSTLNIKLETGKVQVNGQWLPLPRATRAVYIEFDTLALHRTAVEQGSNKYVLQPGLTTLSTFLALNNETSLTVPASDGAFLRARVTTSDGGGGGIASTHAYTIINNERPGEALRPELQAVASAASSLNGSHLSVQVRAAGTTAIVLDIRGAATYDDRPIRLAWGRLPILEPGATMQFELDLLAAAAPWLEGSEPAQDGRYIVYIKDAERPESPGQPVAQFTISGGRIATFAPVTLPMNIVP
jgi:hypothetical protein